MIKPIITAAIATAALVGCATPYQMMADREVDRLCAIDGGTVVFEKVQLSPENFGPNGELFPQYRKPGQLLSLGPDYTEKYEVNVVRQEPVPIEKFTATIRRVNDNKVLGKRTAYIRQGGDLSVFSGLQGTSYVCPSVKETVPLRNSVFEKGGAK